MTASETPISDDVAVLITYLGNKRVGKKMPNKIGLLSALVRTADRVYHRQSAPTRDEVLFEGNRQVNEAALSPEQQRMWVLKAVLDQLYRLNVYLNQPGRSGVESSLLTEQLVSLLASLVKDHLPALEHVVSEANESKLESTFSTNLRRVHEIEDIHAARNYIDRLFSFIVDQSALPRREQAPPRRRR